MSQRATVTDDSRASTHVTGDVHVTTDAGNGDVNAGSQYSRRQVAGYILALGALVALGPFTIDLYLPAFPAVAKDLLTSDAAIQLTLTATTLGFALGQLIVGPLSDSIGRRKPLITMTAVHVVASIGVALAPSVELVMVGRALQGIGAAGSAVVAMAMVRDMFGGQRMIRVLSRMALVQGFAPVFAPVIGSQLLRVMDWRGIFVFLAAYGVAMCVVASLVIPETLPDSRRGKVSMRAIGMRYRKLLGSGAFVGVALMGAATATTLFSYLTASSFVLQDQHGLTPQQFGYVFGINSAGLVVGTQVSARLMRRMAPFTVAATGLSVMITAAVALLVGWILDAGLLGVIVPLVFILFSAGLVFPTINVMALGDHPREAGTAAALIGAVNMGFAGLFSPLVGLLGNTAGAMAMVMVGALTVGHVVLWTVVRPRVSLRVVGDRKEA